MSSSIFGNIKSMEFIDWLKQACADQDQLLIIKTKEAATNLICLQNKRTKQLYMIYANVSIEPDNKPWRFSGKRCPKCGGEMINNHKGHECGELNYCYIEPAQSTI